MTSERDIDAEIKAVNPAELTEVERLRLEAAKDDLFCAIVSDSGEPEPKSGGRRRWRPGFGTRRRGLALGAAMCAAGAAALLLLAIGLGSAGAPSKALGAPLERLAKVSPHVILDAPGWRAEAGFEVGGESGSIHYHQAAGPTWARQLGGRLKIAAVESAQLDWRVAATASPARPNSKAVAIGTSIALDSSARIYSRAIPGSPDRTFYAVWVQSGRELQFSSTTPSRESFERRLSALRTVDEAAWLATLPEGRLVRSGGWFTSKGWGEPATSAIAVKRCDAPLPDSVRAGAPRSALRIYAQQCGHTQLPASGPSSREQHHASNGHPGMIAVQQCGMSPEQSLQMTNAIHDRLEAEGKCSVDWVSATPAEERSADSSR
jgi:hypothetical protein